MTRLGGNLNREIPRSSEAYAESKCTAQLAGSDLVILIRGELRVYDSATGVQQHGWPLPDVRADAIAYYRHASRRRHPCSRMPRMTSPPTHSTGTSTSFASRTKDATVAAGTLARFMSTGLVYADGTTCN